MSWNLTNNPAVYIYPLFWSSQLYVQLTGHSLAYLSVICTSCHQVYILTQAPTGRFGHWPNGFIKYNPSTQVRQPAHDTRVIAIPSYLTMARSFFWTSRSHELRSQVGLLRYLPFQLLQQHRSFIPIIFPEFWAPLWTVSTQDRIKGTISWLLNFLMDG